MHFQRYLAQPHIGRRLRAARSVGVGVGAVLVAAAAVGVWFAQRAVTDARERAALQRHHLQQDLRDLQARQADAARAASVVSSLPGNGASAGFADEMSRFAAAARVTLARLQIHAQAAGPGAGAPRPATPADAGKTGRAKANASTRENAAAWQELAFDGEVLGRYDALMDFLRQIGTSPRILQISKAQIQRRAPAPGAPVPGGPAGPSDDADALPLKMSFSGQLFGVPQNLP
jgi:cell division protein FtsL